MDKNFFIFGYGYTTGYLTNELNDRGFRVVGTSRDPSKFAQSEQLSIINFNNTEEVKKQLSQSTHVLIAAPPALEGDPTLLKYLPFLNLFKKQFLWIGYLSSTGVYGDYQGAWVNENSVTHASTPHAALRLQAEKAWVNLALQQFPIHVFRLAGIYGPKRNAIRDIINGKRYSVYKNEHYFSRIHVRDIVQVLMQSIETPTPGEIYNVADDLPTPSHIVDAYAANLLNQEQLPLLSFTEASLSPMAKEFYSANRKIKNTKMKQQLNIKLIYPTFQEGLLALFNQKEY